MAASREMRQLPERQLLLSSHLAQYPVSLPGRRSGSCHRNEVNALATLCAIIARMRSKSAQSIRPSEVVGQRLRAARERKPWTQLELATAMTAAGWPIDRSTIAKIESGGVRGENVALNEFLAFAIVLGVSPIYLIVPDSDKARITLTAEYSLDRETFRWWVSGQMYRDWRPRPGTTPEQLATLKKLRADWHFFQYMQSAINDDEKRRKER